MKIPQKTKSIAVILLIIAFFYVLNLNGFLSPLKNFFYSISSPIQQKLWKSGINVSDFFSGIMEIKTLKKETEDLKIKNQELIAQIADLKELKKENENLRQALNIGLEKEFQLKLSNIVSKDVLEDSILITGGMKDGIKKGMPVITKEKVLAGRIGEVYENYSEVILITNKKSSFDAQISEKEIFGVVKGTGNSGLRLELIPKEKEVLAQDIVVSTTLGNVFPKGLLVGEIKEVKTSDLEPYQNAEIKPAFEFKRADSLFVIINF
ncbi:MAG: rod shape-determining protein MreC [Bacteroidia bacterium]|nr:rod shape-determining protein MreC [Bacteroidia bacterium]